MGFIFSIFYISFFNAYLIYDVFGNMCYLDQIIKKFNVGFLFYFFMKNTFCEKLFFK